jgi:uncharacterized protein YndB with AHSA1/START domain
MTPDVKTMPANPTASSRAGAQAAAAGGVPPLRVERVFDATPERLWEHFTDPAKYAKWLNPGRHDLKIQKWDLRVGGECRFVMPLDDGSERTDGGVFFVLDKPRRIQSGAPDKSFLLEATFTPVDAKRTRVTVVTHGIPPEWHAMASQGWGRSFDKLAALVAGRPARPAEEAEPLAAGQGFRLVRTFSAPPSKVFQMWTTKEGLAKWWGPSANAMGYQFRVDKLDVRAGGEYDIVMSNEEHGELHNHGRYVEVVPNKRIVQEWHFDIFLGPGEKPYPISLTVELEEAAANGKAGTRLTFTQGPMASVEHTEGSRQGVMQNLSHLGKALGG